MEPKPRRRPLALIPVLAAGIGAGGGCGDECDKVGETWCSGTAVLECYRSGGGGHRSARNLIKSTDCADEGLICSAETGEARCVFEERRCNEEANTRDVCVGDVRAVCEARAKYPVPVLGGDCSRKQVSKYCVESDLAARCSPYPELCSADDPDRCEHGLIFSCVEQIWLSQSGLHCVGECETDGAMQCVETTDERGEPLELVTVCSGEPGIWRRVGAACESGCTCEGEPETCRCQDRPESFQLR